MDLDEPVMGRTFTVGTASGNTNTLYEMGTAVDGTGGTYDPHLIRTSVEPLRVETTFQGGYEVPKRLGDELIERLRMTKKSGDKPEQEDNDMMKLYSARVIDRRIENDGALIWNGDLVAGDRDAAERRLIVLLTQMELINETDTEFLHIHLDHITSWTVAES